MNNLRTWTKIWPACGIASIVLQLGGLLIHGYPGGNASADAVARWASTMDPARFAIGIYVEALGLLLFVIFFAGLANQLRADGGPGWLMGLGVVMVAIWSAAGILDNGVWTGLLDAGREGVDGRVLVTVRDVATDVFQASNLLLALAVICIGLASLTTRALPFRLGWAAAVIGLGLAVPPLSLPAAILLFLWIVVVAVFLFVRPPLAVAPPAPEL